MTASSTRSPLALGPNVTLPAPVVEQFATTPAWSVMLTNAAERTCNQARDVLTTLRDDDTPIYGITTGFGPLVHHESADSSAARAESLVNHLSAGTGPLTPPAVVRALMMLRLHTLAQGHSGIRPPVLHALKDALNENLTPAVPTIGSVGASGDLTPLAFVARVLMGKGHCLRDDGTRINAAQALENAGLTPVELDARDALGLVNGTSFMTAYAALACARAQRLCGYAEAHTGWVFRLLGARLDPLDADLHAVRGHDGQQQSADAIRAAATEGDEEDAYTPHSSRPLQEAYSLRCAPQVLGACRDQIAYATRLIETELNGVSDNPLLFGNPPRVCHGGNFQGQQIAFASDALNAALTQIGVLMERQLEVLLTPKHNGGAPPLLAWTPGATHGFAGAQITATALVAELRQRAQMTATSSIPTNGGNQDVVSMGALAARTAYEQTPHVARILSIHTLAALQLRQLQQADKAEGTAPIPPQHWPAMDPLKTDRPLYNEINSFADTLLSPPAHA